MENMEKSELNSDKIWTIWNKIGKGYEKYGRKASWIVTWYGQYRRKKSWKVKRNKNIEEE